MQSMVSHRGRIKGGANKEVGDGHSGPETGASISVDLAPRAFMPGTAVVTE